MSFIFYLWYFILLYIHSFSQYIVSLWVLLLTLLIFFLLLLLLFASILKYLCVQLNPRNECNFWILLSLNNKLNYILLNYYYLLSSPCCYSVYYLYQLLLLLWNWFVLFNNNCGNTYKSYFLLFFLYYNSLFCPYLKANRDRCNKCFSSNGYLLSTSKLRYCVNLSKCCVSFMWLCCAISCFVNNDLL